MQTDNSTRANDLKKSDVWKKPPQNIKKRTKKFRFRDFSRDVFEKKNIEDTLGSNFYIRELCRYEYVRIPRKRERKTGVF